MAMHRAESELEMTERHVREGEKHIARQREIIAEFTAKGFPTEEAERLLQNLKDLQRQHVDDLTRIQFSN
jgi:hypothetical protein